MRFILLIVILTLTACSKAPEKFPEESLRKYLAGTNNNVDKDSLSMDGDSEYLDSANFHIIRKKYVSGNKFLKVYENTLTRLDSCKQYYENGQLKEEGIMINASHIYVGIWKYYSMAGKLDSTVDHDRKFPVSYFKALKIAEKAGFRMPGLDVSLRADSLSSCWEIARRTENEKKSGQTAQVIQVDTRTGVVTKPKYQLISVY